MVIVRWNPADQYLEQPFWEFSAQELVFDGSRGDLNIRSISQ